MAFVATDGKTFETKAAMRKHEMFTQYTFSKKREQKLSKAPGQLNGQPFDISDLTNCEVTLLDHTDMVQIDYVEGCNIFVAACCEAVWVRECEGCTFTIACKQLRVRDAKNCTFHLYSKTEPVIETSSDLKFGPFNGAYPEHEAHMKAASLDLDANFWWGVFDFSDERNIVEGVPTGKNWSLLPEAEYAAPWCPLGEAASCVPPSAPGSKPLPSMEGKEGSASGGMMSFSFKTNQEDADQAHGKAKTAAEAGDWDDSRLF